MDIPAERKRKTMRRDELLNLLTEHRAEIRSLGAKSLAVFGSFARDEARQDSDVDLLVEFDAPPTFNQFMDLKFYLEDLSGRRVDLGTSDSIKARVRQRILREAIYVAGL